jgi:hypothetical protein
MPEEGGCLFMRSKQHIPVLHDAIHGIESRANNHPPSSGIAVTALSIAFKIT